jgi:aarF domain-containing kinase
MLLCKYMMYLRRVRSELNMHDVHACAGEEIPEMEEAHVQAGSLVGTPFGTKGIYDFGSHNQLTKRVAVHSATMLKHRLKAPPPEVYSLHRRLAGAFLVNMKLRAKVPCKSMFDDLHAAYEFGPVGEVVV